MSNKNYRTHSESLTRAGQKSSDLEAGVVGLGLMGTSIVTCLLVAGHCVVGVEVDEARRKCTRQRVLTLLKELKQEGLSEADPHLLVKRVRVADDYAALANCAVVIEAIAESVQAKRRAMRKIENVVSPKALVCSNTSAIPITEIQHGALHPERILGVHWAEPAHVTRFMEIIRGRQTSPTSAQRAANMASNWWRKEPSLVRRDVRGFITNRISYAMFREAFHLVETGVATVADVDRSLRNDVGYWITFAGPFRYMDLTGIPAYERVMRDLLPDLSSNTKVPRLMRKIVGSGGRGVANGRGFYRYTPAQAKRWGKLFLKFSYEIRRLAMKYPEDIGDRSR